MVFDNNNNIDTAFAHDSIDNALDQRQLNKIVASGAISFLFGAGVNGAAFENFRGGFLQTKTALRDKGQPGEEIEAELSNLEDSQYDEVLNTLVEEFNRISINIDMNHSAIANLQSLLDIVFKIVNTTENRQLCTKKVSIFTLNYDQIVENILDRRGYFYHSVAAKKPQPQESSDVIGYNTVTRVYVPTFAVLKLHGTANQNGKINKDSIILPGGDKLRGILSNEFFEPLFLMKTELLKPNAVLFVIGYSGADIHVNDVLRDATNRGLTVIWLQYSDNEWGSNSEAVSPKVFVVRPVSINEGFQDTTKTLYDLLFHAAGIESEV